MKRAALFRPVVLTPLALILTVGCVRVGIRFSPEKTERVLTGATMQEVKGIMGVPNIVSSTVIDGEKFDIWTWSFSSSAGFIAYKGRAESFSVAFGRDGRVVEAPRTLSNVTGWSVFSAPNVAIGVPVK